MTEKLAQTEITKPEETAKTRKRKLLIDLEKLWAECKTCKEPGNLENLIRHQLPIKNLAGVKLYMAFDYVYFCSENCQRLMHV